MTLEDLRFRSRSTPSPRYNNATMKIGELTPWAFDFSPPQATGPKLNQFVQGQPPYLKAELTWDQKNPGPPYRQGGPFANMKISFPPLLVQGHRTCTTAPEHRQNPNGTGWIYVGGFSDPSFAGDILPGADYVGLASGVFDHGQYFPDLSVLGPEAYRKARPPIEEAGAGQFFAELRDIPRMLKTTAEGFKDVWKSIGGKRGSPLMQPKKVADQFLNEQFGWAPFIGDLVKFDHVYRNSADYIDRIKRQNDQWVRRSRVLNHTETIETLASDNIPGVYPAGDQFTQMCRPMTWKGNTVRAYYETTVERVTHTWTTGLFKYYRPEFDSNLMDFDSNWKTAQRYLTLYGLRANPSVLYKITPWSWLADWFTNLGDNIDNASARAFDGSLSKNLYIMAHTSRIVKFKSFYNFWDGPLTTEWYRNIETKQRAEGGPYGFGWSQSDLSPRQLAILGALGITRFT